MRHIVNEILASCGLRHITRIEPVKKGWSADDKYILWEREYPAYLLRVSDIAKRERRQREYDLLKAHYIRDILCSEPITWGTYDDANAYTLMTYIPGVSAEDLLPKLTPYEQFEYGRRAGETLKQLHAMPHPDPDYDWPTRRIEKYRCKVEEVGRNDLHFHRQEEIEAYIEANLSLLADSPVRFQHDDFHPGNLIVSDNGEMSVIDFNNCDWGDPVEDFFKVPKYTHLVSIPFGCGQIVGYNEGEVSQAFWTRYNFFVAMNQHASTLSAHFIHRFDESERMQHIANIIEDHDFSEGGPPRWFRNYACNHEGHGEGTEGTGN